MLAPDELQALQEGLKEGHVDFRFEGRNQGRTILWVTVEATLAEGKWAVRVRMGDGSDSVHVLQPEEAEARLSELIEEIKKHFEERAEKPN